MISVQREETIRHLLSDGLSIRGIADRMEVSRTTVQAIKRASGPRIRKRKTPQTKQKTPAGRKRLRESRKCEICGALLKTWPCVLCHPFADNTHRKESKISCSEIIAETTAAESLELFRIVRDLQALSRLHLIENPLFTNLANRAAKSLERIFPQTKEKNATNKNTTAE